MTNTTQKINVNWLDQKQVAIHLDFGAMWSWDDFYLAHDRAFAMVKDSEGIIDLVYTFQAFHPLPKGYYGHLLRIKAYFPQNLGLVLWAGCHPIILKMVRNVTVHQPELTDVYGFVENLDEAKIVAGP